MTSVPHIKKMPPHVTAFMAIKRLEKVTITDHQKADDARSLVKWFKSYRDYVIDGAWYPDLIFKDMATSHIIKYIPDPESADSNFKKLPSTIIMYDQGKRNPLYGRAETWQTDARRYPMTSSTISRCSAQRRRVVLSARPTII